MPFWQYGHVMLLTSCPLPPQFAQAAVPTVCPRPEHMLHCMAMAPLPPHWLHATLPRPWQNGQAMYWGPVGMRRRPPPNKFTNPPTAAPGLAMRLAPPQRAQAPVPPPPQAMHRDDTRPEPLHPLHRYPTLRRPPPLHPVHWIDLRICPLPPQLEQLDLADRLPRPLQEGHAIRLSQVPSYWPARILGFLLLLLPGFHTTGEKHFPSGSSLTYPSSMRQVFSFAVVIQCGYCGNVRPSCQTAVFLPVRSVSIT